MNKRYFCIILFAFSISAYRIK